MSVCVEVYAATMYMYINGMPELGNTCTTTFSQPSGVVDIQHTIPSVPEPAIYMYMSLHVSIAKFMYMYMSKP